MTAKICLQILVISGVLLPLRNLLAINNFKRIIVKVAGDGLHVGH